MSPPEAAPASVAVASAGGCVALVVTWVAPPLLLPVAVAVAVDFALLSPHAASTRRSATPTSANHVDLRATSPCLPGCLACASPRCDASSSACSNTGREYV